MKTQFGLLPLLVLLFSFGGCDMIGKKLGESGAKEFDYGKVENNVYTNTFFGLEIPLPKDWVVRSKEQMEQLKETGKKMLSGDEAVQKAVEAAEVNTAYLISVSKYELGSAVAFNPSLIAVAENTKLMPGIKTGKDYLFHARKLLESTQLNYVIDDEFVQKDINGKEFYVMNASVHAGGQSVYQEYISTVTDGFTLSFIISYSSDEEKKELHDVLDQVKI